jgi:uncharacterized surface protein with fasciclin (FAS1) repeats
MRSRLTLALAAAALTAGVLAFLPASATAGPAVAPAAKEATGAKDIVDVAVGAGDFKTLAQLLTHAGLVDTLKGPGPFTVFAPTDAAFAKLPKETVEALLKPENKDRLKAILTYHVVAGKVVAADVKAGPVATVNGQSATISVRDGKVFIDAAQVVKTDIHATNGVIHVIDAVILPKDK